MHLTTRTAALAVSAIAPLIVSAPAPAPVSVHRVAQPAGSYTYRGTVQAVNALTGSFDLIIGVGMSLRLVHISTSPTTLLAASGASLRLAGLKPGDVVRADCRNTPTGLVASRIERVEVPRP